jgi:aryl-alcohol dehydrogenase-like predicted oxidoreductase
MDDQMPPHESPLFRRLGLGTVQFGLPYGITNSLGQVPESEVGEILRCASNLGIDMLDTAHLYGSSEVTLGRLAVPLADFRVVTKTPKFRECAAAGEAVDLLRSAFSQSLDRLARPEVYALLLHDADDLTGPYGAELWAAMSELRARGLVRKIGVSVYDGDQIEVALSARPAPNRRRPACAAGRARH